MDESSDSRHFANENGKRNTMLTTEFKIRRHCAEKMTFEWNMGIWQNPSRLRSETAVPIDTILIKLNIIFSFLFNRNR